MLVIDSRFDAFAEQAARGFQLNAVGPAHEGMSYQDLSALIGVAPVPVLDSFAFQMGVDRHLGVAPSTNGRHEVEGHRSALAAYQGGRSVADCELEIPIDHADTEYVGELRLRRHSRTVDSVS